MKTVEQLGVAFKEDHPEYRDLDDAEAGRMVQQDYPGSYDDFIDITPFLKDIQAVIQIYNPGRGRISSWWRTGQSESRGNLEGMLHLEIQNVMAVMSAQIEAATLPQRAAMQHQIEHLMQKNQAIVLNIANSMGMDYATYIQKIQKQLEIDKEVALTQEHSRIRVAEIKDINRIEIDRRWEEIQQDLRSGFIYQNEAQEQLNLLREYINERYKEADIIRDSDGPGMARQLALLEEHIAVMEEVFRERQKELLQAKAQENNQSSDEDTNLR
jgi:hypothetical protein